MKKDDFVSRAALIELVKQLGNDGKKYGSIEALLGQVENLPSAIANPPHF